MAKIDRKKQPLSEKVTGKGEPAGKGQLNEQIRKVAYDLYIKRGRLSGNELGDWFEAEKIVKKRSGIS